MKKIINILHVVFLLVAGATFIHDSFSSGLPPEWIIRCCLFLLGVILSIEGTNKILEVTIKKQRDVSKGK